MYLVDWEIMKKLILLVFLFSHCLQAMDGDISYVGLTVQEKNRPLITSILQTIKKSMKDRELLLERVSDWRLRNSYEQMPYVESEYESSTGLSIIFSGPKQRGFGGECVDKYLRWLEQKGISCFYSYERKDKNKRFLFFSDGPLSDEPFFADDARMYHLRVIVSEDKRMPLKSLMKLFQSNDIEIDPESSCGLMCGFNGRRAHLLDCLKVVKNILELKTMYRYTDDGRIGLTDVSSFLETAPVVYKKDVLTELVERAKKCHRNEEALKDVPLVEKNESGSSIKKNDLLNTAHTQEVKSVRSTVSFVVSPLSVKSNDSSQLIDYSPSSDVFFEGTSSSESPSPRKIPNRLQIPLCEKKEEIFQIEGYSPR